MTRGALPLDERGQIPGQLDAWHVLESQRGLELEAASGSASGVGCSNSRSRLTGGTGPVRGAGVDSWSPCWYVDESPASAAIVARAIETSQRGKLLPEKVLGHRVGWVGGERGMLWVEGHPGDALGIDGLLSPDRLPSALAAITDALWAEGVPVPEGLAGYESFGVELFDGAPHGVSGFAGVRRCDGTVDLRFTDAEGSAVIAGVRGVFASMGGHKWEVIGRGQRQETAYLLGPAGRRKLGRWYDKGLETGEAVAGAWIRAEDQRRYPKGSRRDVAELTAGYVRNKFQQRFYPLWQASRGVTVAGPVVLARKLAQAVEAGDISEGRARGVAVALLEDLAGVSFSSRASGYRWRADARALGLVLGAGVVEEVEIDLHAVVEQALETDHWGRG